MRTGGFIRGGLGRIGLALMLLAAIVLLSLLTGRMTQVDVADCAGDPALERATGC